MLIIPAIDLKDGCVVRYAQGRMNKKVYSKDPLKTARHWQLGGAKLIHVVDLDGAMTGKPKNLELAKLISRSIEVPIQFGGGVRSISAIDALLKAGVKRVVLGTKAVQDKAFLSKAFKKFGEGVIVSVDANQGKLLISGWKKKSRSDAVAFASALKKTGFKQCIYTDIQKDGMLSGPNFQGIKEMLKHSGLQIIASGGVSGLNDILRLRKLQSQGLTGVIIGKALYEGKFTLSEAIKASGA